MKKAKKKSHKSVRKTSLPKSKYSQREEMFLMVFGVSLIVFAFYLVTFVTK